jgi:hypothetical protein
MNATNKLIALIFLSLILFGIGAFIGVKLQKVHDKPEYSQNDSIARDSLLNRIDTIKVKETIVRERIRTIYETDTVYYTGTDTACIEIIERKNKLIAGQDTLIDLLDLECRSYSELLRIETVRFAALSFKMDSSIVSYKDSLTAIRKQSDKAIKKEKRTTLFYKVTTTLAAVLGIYSIVK